MSSKRATWVLSLLVKVHVRLMLSQLRAPRYTLTRLMNTYSYCCTCCRMQSIFAETCCASCARASSHTPLQSQNQAAALAILPRMSLNVPSCCSVVITLCSTSIEVFGFERPCRLVVTCVHFESLRHNVDYRVYTVMSAIPLQHLFAALDDRDSARCIHRLSSSMTAIDAARSLQNTGDWQLALQQCELVLQQHPNRVEHQLIALRCLQKLGQLHLMSRYATAVLPRQTPTSNSF